MPAGAEGQGEGGGVQDTASIAAGHVVARVLVGFQRLWVPFGVIFSGLGYSCLQETVGLGCTVGSGQGGLGNF